jgi:hypothetical protein
VDLPWEAWAQAFVMLAPVVIVMIWWDWRQRCKSRALWKRADEAAARFDAWVDQTVQCPACQGAGRVRKFEIRKVV